jgi:hypothetical protein
MDGDSGETVTSDGECFELRCDLDHAFYRNRRTSILLFQGLRHLSALC